MSEPGQNKVIYSGNNLAAAKTEFGKKFKDKTKNAWGPGVREKFKSLGSSAKAYTLMDMADTEEIEENPLEETEKAPVARKKQTVKACTLTPQLQGLLSLLFNEDTITEQLQSMSIDTKRMPLGRISQSQLEKGREVLEKLAKVAAGETKGDVGDLTAEFYTLVPHSFGRQRPPPLRSREAIQEKFDLINTLTDVTVVQDLLAKEKADAEAAVAAEVPHPLDRQYKDLDCDIVTLSPDSDEYDYIQKYFAATQNGNLKLKNIYRMDRKSEAKRFAENDSLENRKLLWHGTNIAVVVAIIKTGLRIMPHSGGRVGRGIYHASENSKSAGYTRSAKKTGIMFVNEVALGKIHEITADDWSITKPPAGFDSVLAQGWTEPDPSKDRVVKLDGKDVVVPQGKAGERAKWKSSRFSQSEYLVYKESQVRMRYMLEITFPY